jgi:lysophosphatidic acid acyltransferase / lysophosphatidylinositol acyltransferase
VRDLGSIFDYPKDLFFNVSIYPEGTRYTRSKYEASMIVAKEKGMPCLKHHLLPRTKGFTVLASQIKGHADYLYDITFAIKLVNGEKPSLEHIKDGIPTKGQIFLRRIPISDIPVDDEKKCAEYLHQLYREKV